MEQIVYRQQLEGVIMVEQVTREENYSMPYRHFHDTFELYYLTEGESYYFIDRETYLVKAGDMVLIKPDRVHKTSLAKPASDYGEGICAFSERKWFSRFGRAVWQAGADCQPAGGRQGADEGVDALYRGGNQGQAETL